MIFKESDYSKAEQELSARRKAAEELAEKRRCELAKQYPQLIELEDEMKNTVLTLIKSLSTHSGGVNVEELKEVSLAAQAKRLELIRNAGFPDNYLDPPYTCRLCKDTGFVDGRMCSCHISLLKKYAAEELSCGAKLATNTFDTFDLKYYSDKKDPELECSPRVFMKYTVDELKEYIENFPNSKKSFIFCGSAGVGKTHLALAVMNELIEKDFSVYYGSTWKIVKEMQKEAFGKSTDDILEEILENDFIIIDDLGSEFESSFSKSAVFELIEGINLSGKPMIICTSLAANELDERYGEKVCSRLSALEPVRFVGTDIRQMIKHDN